MSAPVNLEQQLDALIAEHGLTSIGLTRIRMHDGTLFWGVNVQGDGKCGSNTGDGQIPVSATLTAALDDLNKLRAPPTPVVPELVGIADEPLTAEAV